MVKQKFDNCYLRLVDLLKEARVDLEKLPLDDKESLEVLKKAMKDVRTVQALASQQLDGNLRDDCYVMAYVEVRYNLYKLENVMTEVETAIISFQDVKQFMSRRSSRK